MKKEISDEDIIVFKEEQFNGMEISYADLTSFLKERIILKLQMAIVKEEVGV